MRGTNANVRGAIAWLVFLGFGGVCGGLACAVLGAGVSRQGWSPPLEGADQQTFVTLSALTGTMVGAVTGLIVRASVMHNLGLPGRMAAWGVLGGWGVLVFISGACFMDPLEIGGPVFYARGGDGFRARLADAVLVPLLYGAWILAALGVAAGAGAAVGWWLLSAAIRRRR